MIKLVIYSLFYPSIRLSFFNFGNIIPSIRYTVCSFKFPFDCRNKNVDRSDRNKWNAPWIALVALNVKIALYPV